MTKKEQLQKIAEGIRACEACKKKAIGMAVPGEGNPNARIVFIGEAPGKKEAETGRPFVGRSGKFLREEIQRIGLSEDKVYITSPVKYLPIQKTPDPSQISHGRIHLLRQLAVIQPRIIVLLGKVAAKAILEHPISITKDHGKTIMRNGKIYFLSYHPAAALRFQNIRKIFISDFDTLKILLKKENIFSN